jgi:hypothetical protein
MVHVICVCILEDLMWTLLSPFCQGSDRCPCVKALVLRCVKFAIVVRADVVLTCGSQWLYFF